MTADIASVTAARGLAAADDHGSGGAIRAVPVFERKRFSAYQRRGGANRQRHRAVYSWRWLDLSDIFM